MNVTAYKDFIVQEGEVLFREGDILKYVYLIKTGSVMTVKENQERYFPLGLFSAGDFLGGVNGENGNSVNESAVAMSKCIITPMPKNDIKSVVTACPQWVGDVLDTVSHRLKGSMELIAEHKLILSSEELGQTFSDEDEAMFRKVLNA